MSKSLRVLIIDDSESDGVLLLRTLRKGDFAPQSRRVDSAQGMRAALSEQPWDVALADCYMPGFSAEVALDMWRAGGNDRPFIVVSGAVGEEEVVGLLKAGAHDFVRKDRLARLVPALERELHEAIERQRRRQAEADLRKFSYVVEQSPVSVVITDADGNIEYVNRKFTELTGYESEEVIREKPSLLESTGASPAEYHRLWETIRAEQAWRGEFRSCKKNGEYFWESVSISPIRGADGAITHFLAIKEDITKDKEASRRVWLQANYDQLTSLPNRNLFMDRLGQALAKAARTASMVALMYLDLDRFKYVNDTMGHDAGDDLLKQAAERLSDCVRESDTVSRLGGDEFTVILPDVRSQRAVVVVAQKILDALSRVFIMDNREAYVGASIGITLSPADGTDPRNLLKNADTAMYRAKEAGRNTYQFFTPEMNVQAQDRVSLENDLRNAMDRGEFYVVFQPIVHLASNEVVCIEALLRWNRPGHGDTPPARFIPVAEETGLIKPIGEWVMRTACGRVAGWTHPRLKGLRVGVNLSSAQCQSSICADLVRPVLTDTGLPGCRLTLEITESMFIGSHGDMTEALNGLKGMGVRLSIDDFGTGYSSLSYLKRFPVDTLKIDHSFIRDIVSDPEDRALCQAIIALARNLKLKVVAEGVETQEQLAFLRKWRCDLVQGQLISAPLSLDEFEDYVCGGDPTAQLLQFDHDVMMERHQT